jgi:hypothetical protein
MNWLIFLVPACLKCQYYRPHPGDKWGDLGRCTKLNVTLYAEHARLDEQKCGLHGKWFKRT